MNTVPNASALLCVMLDTGGGSAVAVIAVGPPVITLCAAGTQVTVADFAPVLVAKIFTAMLRVAPVPMNIGKFGAGLNANSLAFAPPIVQLATCAVTADELVSATLRLGDVMPTLTVLNASAAVCVSVGTGALAMRAVGPPVMVPNGESVHVSAAVLAPTPVASGYTEMFTD